MIDPSELGPLSNVELDRLGAIITEHCGDDGFNVELIDGLFAALVCSPILAQPSEWLPLVWGGKSPDWKSAEEFQEVFGLLMRHWNHVAETINDGSYTPIVSKGTDSKGEVVFAPYFWCYGFDIGMRTHEEVWFDDSDSVLNRLLAPITFLRADLLRASQGAKKDRLSHKQREEYLDQVSMTVTLLRQYWLKRFPPRREADAASRLATARSAKVRRNEPCPCGSGKKYKHCHGAGGVR